MSHDALSNAAQPHDDLEAFPDGTDIRTLVIAADDARGRLDRVLAAALPELSRTRLKALIEAGCVEIDGVETLDPSRKLAAGCEVRIAVPPPEDPTPQAQDIPLTIVHEDDDLIVIDKPAGLVVHPAPGATDGTLVNALIGHCGDTLSGVGGVRRPGIVHRLDKDTTGLIVVAKHDRAHRGLASQFADHGRTGPLQRRYLALVWGRLRGERGVISTDIGRDPRRRERMAVLPGGRGRLAVTRWRTLRTFPPGAAEPLVSLVACELETGRTHQIRVHMAHAGHPLLGDAIYGAGFKTRIAKLSDMAQAALATLGRQALHAAALGFEHPVTHETLLFESEPPADMAHLIASLENTAPEGAASVVTASDIA